MYLARQERRIEFAHPLFQHLGPIPATGQQFRRRGQQKGTQFRLARLKAGDFDTDFCDFVGRGYGVHGRFLSGLGAGSQDRVNKG